MSTTILPSGASTSIPIPMAAAIGSYIIYTSRPPACSEESLTALISTSVLPEGMQTTILRAGLKKRGFSFNIFIIPRIICSAASKSAITPSLRGLTVLMLSCVFPCICLAFSPIAMSLPVLLSMATIEGSSTTILSFCMMIVFAVPRSIAISCVKKEKIPISVSSIFI